MLRIQFSSSSCRTIFFIQVCDTSSPHPHSQWNKRHTNHGIKTSELSVNLKCFLSQLLVQNRFLSHGFFRCVSVFFLGRSSSSTIFFSYSYTYHFLKVPMVSKAHQTGFFKSEAPTSAGRPATATSRPCATSSACSRSACTRKIG